MTDPRRKVIDKLPKVPSYITNVVKSVGYIATDRIKKMAPATEEFISTNSELTRDIYSSVRDYKSTIKNVGKMITGSEIYATSNNIFKNAMDDLKTGNFYNKAREDAMMDEVFGGDGFDFGMDTGFDNAFDDGSSEQSSEMAGFEGVSRVSVKNTDVLAKTIKDATGTAVSTAVNNSRDIANSDIIMRTNHFNSMIGKLGSMENTMITSTNMIVEQLQNLIDPTLQFFNNVDPIFKDIAGNLKEIADMQRNMYAHKNKELEQQKFKDDSYVDMLGSNGTLDMTQYAKSVMGNIGKEFDTQTMGMFDMFGGPSGFFKMMAASPLSVIPNMLVSLMIPTMFTKSIGRLDDTISGLFTSMIAKFTSWQESDSPLKKMVGRLFGLKVKKDEDIRLGDYNVETGSLDKMSHRTINTVIPAYLREIVTLLGGTPKIMDHTTGTFKSQLELRNEYNKTLDNVAMAGVSDQTSKLNERIDMLLEGLTDVKQVQEVKDDMNTIMKRMVDTGGLYTNFNKMDLDDFESTLGGVNLKGGDKSFKIISSLFNSLDESEQMQIAKGINSGRESRRKAQQAVIGDLYAKGYNTILDGSMSGYGPVADEKGGVKLAPLVDGPKDDFVKTSNMYLRDIKSILLRGIKVFGMTSQSEADINAIRAIDSDYAKMQEEKSGKSKKKEDERKKEENAEKSRQKEIESKLRSGELKPEDVKDDIDDITVNSRTAAVIRRRVEVKEEKDAKAEEENSIMYQLFGETLMYKHFKESKGKIQKLMDKPFAILTKLADTGTSLLHQMVFGKDPDTDKAKGLFSTIRDKFDGLYRKATDWLSEKVGNPIKAFFMGDGKDKEGLISKINKTVFNPLQIALGGLFGMDTDSFDSSNPNSMKELRKGMADKVKVLSEKVGLFDMLKGAGIGGALGLFTGNPMLGALLGSSVSILKRSESFQTTLFGEMGEDGKRQGGLLSKEFTDNFKKKLPQLGIGAGIGALLSTGIGAFVPGLGILGSLFTPFGMIGGALTGMGVSIAGTSDKFKNWLLGDVDADGKRQGGVLSKSLSNNLGQTLIKSGVGGATGGFLGGKLGALIGAGMSFIPGLGLLGSVMGPAGAIGGTILGMGFGIASSTDRFKEMLFGSKDETTGERDGGLFNKSFREKFKSIAPKAGLGAIVGGLTFGKLFGLIGSAATSILPGGGGLFGSLMGPAGILGGALMGLGLTIAASSDTFKEKMFGSEDEGKEKKKPVLERMSDWMNEKLLTPLKGWFDTTAIRIGDFFKDSIAVPFQAALTPLQKEFKLMTESMKEMFKSAWDTTKDAIGNIFEQHVGKPFGEIMEEKVLKPLKGWISKIVGGIGKFFGGIIASPIKLLTAVAQSTYRKHTRNGDMDYGDEMGDNRAEYEKKVSFGDRIDGVFNKFFKTKSLTEAWAYAKDQFKGFKMGMGLKVTDSKNSIKDTIDGTNSAYKKVKDEVGDSVMAATTTTLGVLNTAIDKLSSYLFGAAEANAENIQAQKEATEAMQGVTEEMDLGDPDVAKMADPNSAIILPMGDSIADKIKAQKEAEKTKPKVSNPRPKNAQGQATPKESDGNQDSTEADRQQKEKTQEKKQGEKSAIKGLKLDHNKGVPSIALQRAAHGIIIDTIPMIQKDVKLIASNVDGQLDGIGDNINRIRHMLSEVFNDEGAEHNGNKKRRSILGRAIDMVLAPIRFVTKAVTNIITAPFKLLAATAKGLAFLAKETITTITSTAVAVVQTIGTIAKTAVHLLAGAAKGLGSILSGIGSVIGQSISFLGSTIFETGKLVRDGLFGAIRLAGEGIGHLGKAMVTAAGVFVDIASSVGKVAWSITKGIAKTAYDVVKGGIGFGLDMVSGALGKAVGIKKEEMYITGGKLDLIAQGPSVLPALDPLIEKVSPTKSALRVFVSNFKDIEDVKINSTQAAAEMTGATEKGVPLPLLGYNGEAPKPGEEEKKSEDTPKEETKDKPKKDFKGKINGALGKARAAFASIFRPKSIPESASVMSKLPMIGYNGKSSENNDEAPKQTAENRLALADEIKTKESTKNTAINIQNMSTALVEAQDDKLNALRVRIVKTKEDEEGGIFGFLKKLLPGMSAALLGLPMLFTGLKNLLIDRNGPNSKDIMSTGEEIVRFTSSTAVKIPGVKKAITKAGDYMLDVLDDPSILKNSKVGKFVTNVGDKLGGTKLGQATKQLVSTGVEKVSTGMAKSLDTLIDVTNAKQVALMVSDMIVDLFFAIAEKMEKIPVMKKMMANGAGALRNIAVKFAETVLKGRGFLKTVMAQMAKKGVATVAKTAVKLFKSLATKFFPIASFMEGFTQAGSWNGVKDSTMTEKMISGITFAALDILQGLSMAAAGPTMGLSLIATAILIGMQEFMPYWAPKLTDFLLQALDGLLGTDMAGDFAKRQEEMDNEYKTFRGQEYQKILEEKFNKAVDAGYTADKAQFEKENEKEIVGSLSSKVEYINQNYNKEIFSLMKPSTWATGANKVAKDMIGSVANSTVGAGYDAIKGGLSSIMDKFTGGFEKISLKFSTGIEKSIDASKEYFTSIKDGMLERMAPVLKMKDTIIDAMKGSLKVFAEDPLSPFKKLVDIFDKVKSFFLGDAENKTFIGAMVDGVASMMPSWLVKDKTSGKGTDGNVGSSSASKVKEDPKAKEQPNAITYKTFSQNDKKWADLEFETGGVKEKFSKGGCAPTVMATLLSSLTTKETDPGQLANEALKFASPEGGIKLDYFKKVGAMNGLAMGDLLAFGGDMTFDEDLNPKGKLTDSLMAKYTKVAIEHLRAGKPLVGLVDDGKSRHYVLATGIAKNGNVRLIDPSDGKEYTQPASRFFKAVKYGYAVEMGDGNGAPNGIVQTMKTEGLNMGTAFFNAVKNLISKGIFSYDDLDAATVKSEAGEAYGGALEGLGSVRSMKGISYEMTPEVTQEQMISQVKSMMARNTVEFDTRNITLGAEPTNLGNYKIGDTTIVKNGEVVQFPKSSVVGATKDGRPVFYVGSKSKNELGLRLNYGTGVKGFTDVMAPFAKYAYDKSNLRPGIAVVQAGHETAWGKSIRGNVLFNMKYAAQKDATPMIWTTKEGANSDKDRVATFANFPNMGSSWMAHHALMAKSKHYKGYLDKQWSDPMGAIDTLGSFAEDKKYVSLLKSQFKSYGLDVEKTLGISGPNAMSKKTNTSLDPSDSKASEKLAGKGGLFGGAKFNFNASKLDKTQLDNAMKEITSNVATNGTQMIADKSAGVKNTAFKGNMMNAFKNVGYNLLGSMGLGFIPQAINDVKGNYSMVKSGNKSMMGGIFDSAMSIGDYLGLSPITGIIRNFINNSNRYSTGKNDPLGYAYGGLSAIKDNFMGAINPKYSQLTDLGMGAVDRYMSNRQQNAFVIQPNKFNQSQLDRMTLDAKKDAINKMVQSPQLASDPGLKDAITNSIGNLDTMREGQANDMIKILSQLLESQVQTNQAIVGMLGNNNNSVQTGSGNNTVIVGQKNGMPNPMNTSMADNTLALLEKVKRIASQR